MGRKKGRRTQRKAIEYFTEKGYLVDRVELTSRYEKYKDLFSEFCDGFDLIALKPNEIILIQVKTNRKPTQKTYKEFAKKYANDVVKVLGATWIDYKGWIFQWYQPDGNIIEEDLT